MDGNSNPGQIDGRECGGFIHCAPFFAGHLDPTCNCPLGADYYSGIVHAEFKVCSQQHWLGQVIWQNSQLLTTKITAYFANWYETLFLYLQIQFCLKINSSYSVFSFSHKNVLAIITQQNATACRVNLQSWCDERTNKIITFLASGYHRVGRKMT